ncbi:hypothetical protein KIH74_13955 [Kineosporia sp. J2-2]|uniref:Nucleoside diphosphate kinase-like domain-containing protein n=1 Tax=Kineosporia corallincola TaxID=2835133 RepID=A0ABS5TJ01_9ACTN|nr:nucleoside-diphosphate kinase [Kineosporia corallincola]MBT0770038.1 hypothetical protein [Kineosporia corallincola]
MTAPRPATVREDELRRLSRSPRKVASYLGDPYVRAGLRELPPELVLPVTVAVLKPEAVAGRRLERALRALDVRGFDVVGAWRFRFGVMLIRELWRYQFTNATEDKVDLVDRILTSGDSLLLVLRDRTWTPAGPPAAARLSGVKGSADPRKRSGSEIRAELAGPSVLLNFVHSADEPADVVRELAMLESATGLPVLGAVRRPGRVPGARLRALAGELYEQCPPHDLDEDASWARLAGCPHEPLAAAAMVRQAARQAARQSARQAARQAARQSASQAASQVARRSDRQAASPVSGWPGQQEAWTRIRHLLRAPGPPGDVLWDVLTVAAATIELSVPGLSVALDTVGAAPWQVSAVIR